MKLKKQLFYCTGIIILMMLTTFSLAKAADITVVYGNWKECIAKTYMLKYILEEKVGIKVEIKKMSVPEMWKGVSESKYGAMVCAILPEQQKYYDQYKLDIVDLGPNWIGDNKIVHTIMSKKLSERQALVRFLNNYCLCGHKLETVVAIVEGDRISKKAALKWIKDHKKWIENMMGLCQGFTMEDWG